MSGTTRLVTGTTKTSRLWCQTIGCLGHLEKTGIDKDNFSKEISIDTEICVGKLTVGAQNLPHRT
jgi:hypothetical protein